MLELGNVAAAQETFERATNAKSSYPDTLPNAWNNLGLIATRQGRMQDSVGDFQHALDINPNHLVALVNLGNAYRSLRRWTDAQSVFEHAVEVGPNDAEAHYGLGMVYAQTGESAAHWMRCRRPLRFVPLTRKH